MTKVLVLAIALLVQSPQPSANAPSPSAEAPPMSLAERAAAARKAAAERNHATQPKDTDGPPALTPEQRGTVRGKEYVNDALRFRIDLSSGWEALSSERMARDEEASRKFINPDERPSPYRVLWIGDAIGNNMALSVLPVSPDLPSDLGEIVIKLRQISRAQLSRAENLIEGTEPVLLGDTKHKFGAFRLKYSVQGKPIVQSGQVTRTNGLLMLFTITGSSDQDVTGALHSLNSRLSWSEAR